jgi:hypothetical protein
VKVASFKEFPMLEKTEKISNNFRIAILQFDVRTLDLTDSATR